MYPPLELIHKRCTLSCSQSTTQVDVPSTCTTKDVPSNMLRQRSQAVKSLILCEWRHKRIQAVSPSFFWKREKRNTKRIQAVSPWRILFGKGRRE
ncbi:hypothetical protein HKD37_18G050277 [Glycine soja]